MMPFFLHTRIISHGVANLPQCDQVMEFSWSALWNITDETPDNCQMFLNCRGMSLFLECLQVRLLSLSDLIVFHKNSKHSSTFYRGQSRNY